MTRSAVLAGLLSILLTACSPTALTTTFDKGVQPSEPDTGSSTDQQAVRSAAQAALTDENDAFVINQSLRGRSPAAVLAAVTDPTATQVRDLLLSRARTTKLAADLEDAFSSYAHQEFGSRWTGSKPRSAWLDQDVWATSTFHVDHWQGVQISGNTARALVRGEDHGTTWGGQAKHDTWAQYKLLAVAVGGLLVLAAIVIVGAAIILVVGLRKRSATTSSSNVSPHARHAPPAVPPPPIPPPF